MSVAVIVPWRPGCPHRDRSWSWIRRRYELEHPDWEVIEARAPDGAWCKAAAVMPAAAAATADIVIVADADVWCDELAASVDDVAAGAGWAMPHLKVWRTTATAAHHLRSGHQVRLCRLQLAQPAYRGVFGGGLVVLERATLLQVPMDQRFHGWGQEDVSWAAALTTLAGPCARRTGDLVHLWHPPQPRATRKVGSRAGQHLHQRYLAAARRGPDAMRALLAEASPCPSPS